MNVIIDQNLNIQVILGGMNPTGLHFINEEATISVDGTTTNVSGDMSGEMTGDMSSVMGGDMAGVTTKDPLLSSWPFVIGISTATLAVSIVIGILLAKRKIKKGYELYED